MGFIQEKAVCLHSFSDRNSELYYYLAIRNCSSLVHSLSKDCLIIKSTNMEAAWDLEKKFPFLFWEDICWWMTGSRGVLIRTVVLRDRTAMPLVFAQTQLMSNNSSTLSVQWGLNQTQCRGYVPRVQIWHQYQNSQKEIFEPCTHVRVFGYSCNYMFDYACALGLLVFPQECVFYGAYKLFVCFV